jgi:hypothetical protein
MTDTFHPHRPSFESILEELNDMQLRKGKDYGSQTDPLANICAGEDFGIRPWINAILRAHDKVMRIKAYVRKGKLANERVEDSLLDLAVYTIHALRLYREDEAMAEVEDTKEKAVPDSKKFMENLIGKDPLVK